MGKLTDTTAAIPRTAAHSGAPRIPTSEQIRMAQLLVDPKSEDHSTLKDKVQKVMELTRCDENAAQIALHDCDNDVEQAVDKLLEGGQLQDEWIVQEGKKSKKIHQQQSNLDDSIPSDDFGASGKSFNRRMRGIGGRGGNRSATDGPPRFRGRSRGGTGGKENDSRGDFESGERSGYPRGRGRGGRDGADRGRRGRGFGGRGGRGGGGFNQNGGGFSPIDSWNAPATDDNTWDNNMASALNNGEPAGEWRKRSNDGNKNAWSSSVAQTNDYDWGGEEEDWSKFRDGLVVEPSSARKVSDKELPSASESLTPAPTAPSTHAPQEADAPHVRGENIDVNSLFGSNQTPPQNSVPSAAAAAAAAWTTSQQATADLKHELGIGKIGSSPLGDSGGHLPRTNDLVVPSKMNAAKVELPLGRTAASIGPIDVQFGDMTISSETSQALFEFMPSAQPHPSVVPSRPKDNAAHQLVQQQQTSTNVYQRSLAGGDHVGGPELSAPQPEQQQKTPQQQFASRGTLSGANQMAPTMPPKAVASGVSVNEHQRIHLLPSSSAGSSSVQQNLVSESVAQFARDDVSGQLGAASMVRAASKNQVSGATTAQPMAPYQQAMANVVPYLGMPYDHASLNYLQAQSLLLNAGGLDMRAVNPLSGANITVGRDTGDVKAHLIRQENGSTISAGAAAAGSVGNLSVPPPGLPAPTVSNVENAAQLLNIGLLTHQLQFINAAAPPYMQPQFYVPNVSSASAVTSGAQYQRTGGYQATPALFGASGYEEIQQMQSHQDYGKPNYGVLPPPSAQGKPLSASGAQGSGMVLGGSDVGNKYGGGIKMPYDSKQFATATPPPLGTMNFTPTATGPAQYGYPSYMPQMMNMITAPAVPSNAQLSNDLLSQRGANQNGKPPGGAGGPVAKGMAQQYQYGGPWSN